MNEKRKAYKRKWMQGARALKKSYNQEPNFEYEEERPRTCIPNSQEQSCSTSNYRTVNNMTDDEQGFVETDIIFQNTSETCVVNDSEWDVIDQHVIIASDSEYESENVEKPSLCEDLTTWVNQNNISHNATDQLLKILKGHGLDQLPSTARSLLKTKRNVEVITKAGMEYFYFGLERGLVNNLEKIQSNELENVSEIVVSFNIDGLPLFKSTRTSLWPILCGMYFESYSVQVFPVALCLGHSKPDNLNFLDDFIEELSRLEQHGFIFKDKNIKIKICAFICDAPAKAMIKGIKLYSGYFGCDRCTQTGVWNGRITYQEIDDIELRTDINFRNQAQTEHHHRITPLTQLPIDMIKSFPIDYMHQACLGVMKRLLLLWLRGKRGFKISANQKDEISRNLIQLRKFIPSLFARKPRTLDEVDRWKATEYRQFLLYTGKIVLKSVLKPEFYSHFLTLSVAINILISPQLCRQYLNYARELLKFFISKGRTLYGPEFLVYNVHSLVHIGEDVEEHGHLDLFCAFPFENYMQKLKKMVHSGKSPLVQIVKRVFEMESTSNCQLANLIKKVTHRRPNNGFILTDQSCCEIVQKTNQEDNEGYEMFLCRVYRRPTYLFQQPCDSRLIGVMKCHQQDSVMKRISRKNLHRQAIMIPNDHNIVFLAVLHDF